MERKIGFDNHNYRLTEYTVSHVKYEILFCTREKRKIFKNVKIRERFIEIMETRLRLYGLIVLDMIVGDNYVNLCLSALPDCSPSDVFTIIKKESRIIKEEFSELSKIPNLWTKKFMISTDCISDEMKRKYVEDEI